MRGFLGERTGLPPHGEWGKSGFGRPLPAAHFAAAQTAPPEAVDSPSLDTDQLAFSACSHAGQALPAAKAPRRPPLHRQQEPCRSGAAGRAPGGVLPLLPALRADGTAGDRSACPAPRRRLPSAGSAAAPEVLQVREPAGRRQKEWGGWVRGAPDAAQQLAHSRPSTRAGRRATQERGLSARYTFRSSCQTSMPAWTLSASSASARVCRHAMLSSSQPIV
jgi:hypothetical protein